MNQREKRSQPTYEGKLDHLLKSDKGSVFCLHARSQPIGSRGGHIDWTVVVVVLLSLIVFAEVDAKLIDVAVVYVVSFTSISACKRHVAEQVPCRCFLLQEEKHRKSAKLP